MGRYSRGSSAEEPAWQILPPASGLCAIFVILILLKMIIPYADNKMECSSPEMHRKFVLAFFFLMGLFIISGGCSNDLPEEHKVVQARDGVIMIPLKELNDGKVHFYTYKQKGQPINFFVRTDDAGHISACFDACFTSPSSNATVSLTSYWK